MEYKTELEWFFNDLTSREQQQLSRLVANARVLGANPSDVLWAVRRGWENEEHQSVRRQQQDAAVERYLRREELRRERSQSVSCS